MRDALTDGRALSVAQRRACARALAALFAAGAMTSTVVLLIATSIARTTWGALWAPGIVATIVAAFATAAVLVARAEHVGLRWCQVTTATGTLLIGACQVFAGPGIPAATYSLLYVWVAIHSAMFFSRWIVAAQVLGTVATHVTVVMWLGSLTTALPQVVVMLGTQVAAVVVIARLATDLRSQAASDPLTGLANRRAIEAYLEHLCARADREHEIDIVVAYLDLDGFKHFNDTHGHVAGDALLQSAARAWQRVVRPTDIVARTGGDEFMVVGTTSSGSDPATIVERLHAATPPGVTCSIGCVVRRPGETPTAVIARADDDLYRRKDHPERGGVSTSR